MFTDSFVFAFYKVNIYLHKYPPILLGGYFNFLTRGIRKKKTDWFRKDRQARDCGVKAL